MNEGCNTCMVLGHACDVHSSKIKKSGGRNSTSKGIYVPRYPEKYLGDPTKIRFLSSWEHRFFQAADLNPNVLKWGSEEFKVHYFHPIKKKVCTYIPDIWMQYRTASGEIKTEVIEIKPHKQSVVSNNMSTYDKVQLVINHAKWTACKAICDAGGIRFRVVTEQSLFRTGPEKK